ncbi:MAG: monooxygenase [Hamadaea sp.]|uniref:FAD-dependent monooxygenase n=1 Tax=Hamadaea sp. TaxID=2024425 RepID=UPI001854CDAC|nr:FAD-dependent monooxygenase [Hamadaea sp.]NUR47925.1 monooxygenase [Hamadaea sp.]NUS42094.1 monooxygenase [Mycobacteriaceae bacterium]NUT18925.1 monooxygenase [Hamadaea sp.]
MSTVLISGAGVAGPTLAYWLARAGWRPTVVERAAGQRSSGSPVDVRGPALPVVEAMGVVDELRASATQATGIRFVDSAGRLSRPRSMPVSRSAAGTREMEVPRTDLARILCAAVRDDAEFVYDDTITRLDQDDSGVDVCFERGPARRFDLVVGADGLHSTTRRLAFGPEHDFVCHLGIYIATTPLGEAPEYPHDVLLHNTPGRLVAMHPVRGEAGVAFIFRRPAVPGFDHRDTAQHRRILAEAYAGQAGWRVPELLSRALDADDLYFDAVSKVALPSWSAGRVVLLGDAAASVSLFGDGSSLAIAGARVLADAIADSDHVTAFRRYETEHRRHTAARARGAGLVAGLLVPKTRLGILARNAAARLLPRATVA